MAVFYTAMTGRACSSKLHARFSVGISYTNFSTTITKYSRITPGSIGTKYSHINPACIVPVHSVTVYGGLCSIHTLTYRMQCTILYGESHVQVIMPSKSYH